MRLLTILLILCTATTAHAQEKNIGTGPDADKLRVLSPTGDNELWNEGDFFVINPRGVSGTFSSSSISELQDSAKHTAEYAIWNSSGQMVAICVRTGKYLEDTFVLARQKDSYQYLRLPYRDEDYQAVPLRWLDTSTLLVEVSSPYGGKADHDVYVYTVTLKYDKAKNQFSKTAQSKPRKKA